YGGGAEDNTAVANYLKARNLNSATTAASVSGDAGNNGYVNGVMFPLMFAPGGVDSAKGTLTSAIGTLPGTNRTLSSANGLLSNANGTLLSANGTAANTKIASAKTNI